MRIARRRFVRRQWARRWLAWRRVVVAVVLLAAVVGGVWLVFFSSVLAVAGVQVEGTGVLDPRVVRQAAAVPTGTPLATVDLDAIAARVEDLPSGRQRRRVPLLAGPGPHRRSIEREAVAVVERADGLHGLDATGVMFRQLPLPPAQPAGDPDRASAPAPTRSPRPREVAGSLPAAIARKVDYVEVRTVDTISLAAARRRHRALGERRPVGPQGPGARRPAGAEGDDVRRQRARQARPAQVAPRRGTPPDERSSRARPLGQESRRNARRAACRRRSPRPVT